MFNLSRLILFHIVTVVAVTAQPTPPPRGDEYGLYNRFDPTMLIVVMVLVGSFLLVGFLSVYIRHCNESYAIAAAEAAAASSSRRFSPKGLDTETIKSFPVFVYSYVKELKIGNGALECAVCLSEFEDEETLRFIPKCCHVFHPDCIDAWLAHHVTCPVCRAKLSPPDSDAKAETVESVSDSNITELNSNNNNNESSSPTTERAEEQNEVVIQVNEDSRPRGKITGKFPRSHSTGHSMSQSAGNIERFTLRLPDEIRKQIAKSGRLKRTRSYDVALGMEGSSKKGGDGSSRGKSIIERWVTFSRSPPFVSKNGSLKSPRGGGGDGSISWRGLTSVKEKLNCLNLKSDQIEK